MILRDSFFLETPAPSAFNVMVILITYLLILLLVEIQQYLTYCQSLMKGKRPDYKYLKSLLFDIRNREDSNENMEWYEMYIAEQTD